MLSERSWSSVWKIATVPMQLNGGHLADEPESLVVQCLEMIGKSREFIVTLESSYWLTNVTSCGMKLKVV